MNISQNRQAVITTLCKLLIAIPMAERFDHAERAALIDEVAALIKRVSCLDLEGPNAAQYLAEFEELAEEGLEYVTAGDEEFMHVCMKTRRAWLTAADAELTQSPLTVVTVEFLGSKEHDNWDAIISCDGKEQVVLESERGDSVAEELAYFAYPELIHLDCTTVEIDRNDYHVILEASK